MASLLCGCAAAAPEPTRVGVVGTPSPSTASRGAEAAPAATSPLRAEVSPKEAENVVVEGPPAPPPPLLADGEGKVSEPPFRALSRFYRKLSSLDASRAKESNSLPLVRIGWFGDSHTAADFLTDVVRGEFWSRYVSGGPGFVRVGLADARHGRVRHQLTGRFRHEPFLPAQRERFGDGVFSFSGLRTTPTSGARATLSVRDSLASDHIVRLYGFLGGSDALEVRVGSDVFVVRGEGKEPRSETFSHPLGSGEVLSVELRSGRPRIFGASIESARGGLVLDAIGINGARAATILAWDEQSFRSGLAERPLDVVVLAFGTNEAFDATPLARYPEEYAKVLGRFRAANPEGECLLVGPPDAMTTSGTSLPRVVEIARILRGVADAEGCAFLDQRELMGGDGAFAAWRNRATPWARADRVHLTIAGYEELGRRVAERLLPKDGVP